LIKSFLFLKFVQKIDKDDLAAQINPLAGGLFLKGQFTTELFRNDKIFGGRIAAAAGNLSRIIDRGLGDKMNLLDMALKAQRLVRLKRKSVMNLIPVSLRTDYFSHKQEESSF